MGSLKLLCAVTIAGLVLPGRSFVRAAPHPGPIVQGDEAGSSSLGSSHQNNARSIGEVALQHPNLGLESLPQSGLGIIGNVTIGTNNDGSMNPATTTTAQMAKKLNLTSHWEAPFPPAGSSVQAFEFLSDKWQLWHNRLYGGEEGNLHFVQNPFLSGNGTSGNGDNNSDKQAKDDGGASSTVLKVDYQTGTYRQGGPNSSGGSTFFPSPMEIQDSRTSKSILLKYDVSFDYNFDFVKGGKLPGVFYGSEERDCSGGNLSDDAECFSVRMMWRENGMGEVYAYLPTSNALCPAAPNSRDIICNSDYGTSLGRGKFAFSRGSYTSIMMYVSLNTASTAKDGIVQIWAGDTQVVNMTDLILTGEDMSKSNGTNSMKIFFSTFFGGSTPEWASRVDTSTYFRDLEVYTDATSSSMRGGSDTALSNRNSDEGSHAPPSMYDRTHAVAVMMCYALAVLAALYL